MKPYKIFSMAMIVLLCIALVYNGILYFNMYSNYYILMETMFSFLFPAFIFYLTWLISYKRKNNEKNNNLTYYKELLINVVLPYFLCMLPYIIYKYGIDNLNFSGFLKILLDGNIIKEFTYLKTTIHLLILLPIAEYFAKVDIKKFFITSLAISIVFNLFEINTYIYTEVFNYLVYLAFGISFAYCCKETTYFLRYKNENLLTDMFFAIIFLALTRIPKMYNFFYPAVAIGYNIIVILILTYAFYRNKLYFFDEGKYLYDSKILNPPIIGVSILLLLKITTTFVLKASNFLLNKFSFLYMLIPIILFIIITSRLEKENIVSLSRPKKVIRKIDQYFVD